MGRRERVVPCQPGAVAQLSGMCLAYDERQIGSRSNCFFAAELIDLNLEIVRRQFAEDDRLVEKLCRNHAISQVRRQGLGAREYALGRVPLRWRPVPCWHHRCNSLLDVDQRETVILCLPI